MLFAIVICSVILRFSPLKYGLSLAEVDPYHHYWLAGKFIHGDSVINAVDQTSWYPKERILSDQPLGQSLIAAGLCEILSPLGVDLKTVCAFLPIPFVIFTIILVFVLGRKISGGITGLVGAVLISIYPVYVARSTVGWFENDVIGLLCLLASGYFFIEAIGNDDLKKSLTFTALTAFSVFWVSIVWIGYYAISIISAVYFINNVIRQNATRRSLVVFTLSLLPAMYSAGFIWRGGNMLFTQSVLPFYFVLTSATTIALCGSGRRNTLFSIIVSLAVIMSLSMFFLNPPSDPRTQILFDPIGRGGMAVLPDVAENIMTSPAQIWGYHGMVLAFCVFGVIALIRQKKADAARFFLIIFFFSSLYLAIIMLRFNFLFSVPASLLGALGVNYLLELIQKSAPYSRFLPKSLHKLLPVEKYLRIFFVVFLVLILIPRAYHTVDLSGKPHLIDTSLFFDRPNSAWRDGLDWMRENCRGEVVVAWWDYGNWLKAEGGVVTVCDNTLMYPDQVGKVSLLYLSDEETAATMMREEFGNAKYLLVFVTFAVTENGTLPLLYGDEGVWREMYRLAAHYSSMPAIESYDTDNNRLVDDHCLLGKTALYAMGNKSIEFNRFTVKYVTPIEETRLYEYCARIVILERIQ